MRNLINSQNNFIILDIILEKVNNNWESFSLLTEKPKPFLDLGIGWAVGLFGCFCFFSIYEVEIGYKEKKKKN